MNRISTNIIYQNSELKIIMIFKYLGYLSYLLEIWKHFWRL